MTPLRSANGRESADRITPTPRQFTEPALGSGHQARRYSDGGLDPDQWFPVSADPGWPGRRPRRSLSARPAPCAYCLTLSLQHWDIGQHGVWGGLIADRARLRRQMPPARRGRPQALVVRTITRPAMSGVMVAGRALEHAVMTAVGVDRRHAARRDSVGWRTIRRYQRAGRDYRPWRMRSRARRHS
jgi:hypothetical protein